MKLIMIVSLLVLFMGCGRDEGGHSIDIDDSPQNATLLFSSGFEGPLVLAGPNDPLDPDNADYQFIRGTDAETGFEWPIVLDYLGVVNGGLHLVDVGDDGKAISIPL